MYFSIIALFCALFLNPSVYHSFKVIQNQQMHTPDHPRRSFLTLGLAGDAGVII